MEIFTSVNGSPDRCLIVCDTPVIMRDSAEDLPGNLVDELPRFVDRVAVEVTALFERFGVKSHAAEDLTRYARQLEDRLGGGHLEHIRSSSITAGESADSKTMPRLPAGPVGLGTSAARISQGMTHCMAGTSVVDGMAPPGFPASIPLRRQAYRNWVGAISSDEVWTCTPRTASAVADLANWARLHGYQLRASGRAHSFSPLVITGQRCESVRVVLVDTTEHFAGMGIASAQPPTVWVGAGASLGSLLAYLENHGYGVMAAPACGDLTVGGVLAVGGHGTAVPATGEHQQSGQTYGSLSNLIVSLTAVVWDQTMGQYVVRMFHRSHPDCAAFLTHLGRAFITEVTLRVGTNYALRCVSDVTIPASELFAAPGAISDQSFAGMVDRSGRVEALWFPFTDRTWMKTWTVQPQRPSQSRPVTEPYNYPFSDNIPESLARMVSRVVNGAPELAPELGTLHYTRTALGLAETSSADLWGPSKNLLLYVKPTTLRYSTNGYAILTHRANIQRVVHEFSVFYQQQLHAYQRRGRYPVNGPLEIRVSGLDYAGDVDLAWARSSALSPVSPDRDHPQWDTAIWLDLLSFPGTPYSGDFYREIEEFVFTHYLPPYALPRVEWSKGWAYTAGGPWLDLATLERTVPSTFRRTWQWATATLAAYDPYRIFSNGFLDRLIQ